MKIKKVFTSLLNEPLKENIVKIKNVVKEIIKTTDGYQLHLHQQNKKLLQKLKDQENNKYLNYNTPPIEVVNLNANDICNSKCVMCNIWEQKQGFEFSPNQLEEILKDPLFRSVKHIGVTGGEPTLREDLHLLFEAIIKAIPTIQGLSTITNAIKEKDVIERIDKVIEVCNHHNKMFGMMVSLDGFENTHDKIRGREGNFQSALNVINYFKDKGVNVATGSTISKENVWDMDLLLDFLKEKNIYGRFRVAEFIKRLYNENKTSAIRNFDEDETYNLILFFYKLIYTYESNEIFIRTYKSIINILSGGKRLIGCPYQSEGVVLNSRGEIAYCAPKSEIIGNSLHKSALSIYKENIDEKQRIINSECDNCIHDYHYNITYNELKTQLDSEYWRKNLSIKNSIYFNKQPKIYPIKEGDFQIFITGWYGTETVGDKAILGGIIEGLNIKYGNNYSLIITSIFPIITRRTLKELDITAKVIDAYSSDFIAYAKGSDVIIMGGGPLMDLNELALPLQAFRIGKIVKAKNIIYGSGIGPLYDKKFKNTVKQIIKFADVVLLRDKKSVDEVNVWFPKKKVALSGDPAKIYIAKIKDSLTFQKANVLKCYLREWTYEYNRFLTLDEFKTKKNQVELSLSNLIKNKALQLEVDEIQFEHMHNFVIGNDDRDFSRYFIKKYFNNFSIPVSYNKKLSTVQTIAVNMLEAKHNICMRFHSVVFADSLETSYTAFDYTNGGKIYNYLKDENKMMNLLTVDQLSEK